MQGVTGTIEYINHKGQTILVAYTFFKGKGSQRGETPTQVDINRAMNWMGIDMRGKLTKDELEELELAIWEKEALQN